MWTSRHHGWSISRVVKYRPSSRPLTYSNTFTVSRLVEPLVPQLLPVVLRCKRDWTKRECHRQGT
jgi:hypothetical protein